MTTTIKEIFKQESAQDVIEKLKEGRPFEQPDIELAEKALDPEKHEIMDKIKRPDKLIIADAPEDQSNIEIDGEPARTKVEPVARIRLAIQKLIIKRAVSFLFGNPVTYNGDPENEKQEIILSALQKITRAVKSNTLNRKIARAIFGYGECAELWYPVEKPNSKYGFKSRTTLRCALFSPEFGDTLYPFFDETGDMVAFSREFTRKVSDKEVNYFETYTDSERWLWAQEEGSEYTVVEGFPKKIAIGKIPVVYGRQKGHETIDVDPLIDRLEKLLSNFADTNDYHASPKIFVKGVLKGFAKKGESGAILEGDDQSDAKYLSWENAPASVKLEIETLLNMIYTITQTPDISFESVKGIGAISGIALKLLFMDAHLKVQDKKEIFDDYLQRRANIIKAYIGEMNNSLKGEVDNFEIEPEITPYMLTSEIDELNYWMTANGNKPVIDHESSIEKAGLSHNSRETFERIQQESEKELTFEVGEPTEG